ISVPLSAISEHLAHRFAEVESHVRDPYECLFLSIAKSDEVSGIPEVLREVGGLAVTLVCRFFEPRDRLLSILRDADSELIRTSKSKLTLHIVLLGALPVPLRRLDPVL